jgi:hypothetical protein
MSIKIQSARYGLPDRHNDVTARIQLMVQDSNRTIAINNESMGGDPAYGHGKTLTVAYYGDDGRLHMTEGAEGSTILLGDESHGLPGSSQWSIG